ncbi:MAG: PLP-dependent lyase/thiolase, partial [Ilumatobacteraceae bacterium]
RVSGVSPFVAFRPFLAWDSFAAANGMTEFARNALVGELDGQIAAHGPGGFRITPFERSDRLSDALGFTPEGGVWVKDETGQVGGSHKSRHLFTILLHLRAAETLGLAPWTRPEDRPPLAIASCGNAAIAAATLADAVGWPIRVFVPTSADDVVVAMLTARRAEVISCPRVGGDPAGDPCVHRFREAVARGAVPFSVQGTENVWCLDGGRTIGWEMARQFVEEGDGAALDRVFVQVGGGALAACAAGGLEDGGEPARLHAVQTESSAPLVRAWERATAPDQVSPARRWDDLMWPWEQVEPSAADGILDDETYDWIPDIEAMARTGGRPLVVNERQVMVAHELVRTTTGIDASPTGTAGVAGLLALREAIAADERVAVILSGVARR